MTHAELGSESDPDEMVDFMVQIRSNWIILHSTIKTIIRNKEVEEMLLRLEANAYEDSTGWYAEKKKVIEKTQFDCILMKICD